MKKRCDEIKKTLIIRNNRLNSLNSMKNTPFGLIQNELIMIEELTQELNKQPEEIARKRKEKLQKLDLLDGENKT